MSRTIRSSPICAARCCSARTLGRTETLLVLETGTQLVDLSGSVDALSERLAEAQKVAPMPSVRDYAPSSLMFDLRSVEPAPEAAATEPHVDVTGTG